MKIYVAGPYTAWSCADKPLGIHDAPRVAYQNVRKAIQVGLALIKKGHTPYIPHLTHFIHLESEKDLGEFWYEYDLEWLRCCDALYYMGTSRGADIELAIAKKIGLKIFMSLDDVPEARR